MGLELVLGCRVRDYELTLAPNKTEELRAALAAKLQQELIEISRKLNADPIRAPILANLRQDLLDSAQDLSMDSVDVAPIAEPRQALASAGWLADDKIEDASFAELPRRLGWQTDEKVAANG